MNKVFLRGNVGGDPRITTFENGGKVAQFTLATTEKGFTTRDGQEIEDETTWHNIVVRKNGLAGVVEKYVKKGSSLLLEGRIRNRKYVTSSGEEKYISEVWVSNMELLDKRGEGIAPAPEEDDMPI